MKKVLWRFGRAAAGAALVLSLLAPPKAAADFYYHLNNTFSGSSPSGPAPWIDALFQDVTPGTVDLTISAVGLTGTEFLSEFYINLNPLDSATNLVFTTLSTIGTFALPIINEGTDSFKADGDGKYDVRFDFGTASGTTFNAGDSITYQITGIAGLTALDFNFLSLPAGGHGPFLAAGHVQGIVSSTDTSGWISPTGLTPVPEPSAGVLLSAALGLFGGMRWFFARAKRS